MPGSGKGFEPGQSGNPAGKAKGTRNRTTLAMEAILEGEAETLTRKAIELACEGDTVALRLCLDHLAPVRKDRHVVFDLPAIETTADLPKATHALLQAIAAGDLAHLGRRWSRQPIRPRPHLAGADTDGRGMDRCPRTPTRELPLSIAHLNRRLSRIKSGRHEGAPTAILADRPPGVGPEIHVEDWQAWVADGLGIVTNSVLCVTGSELTVDEWAARHVTEH